MNEFDSASRFCEDDDSPPGWLLLSLRIKTYKKTIHRTANSMGAALLLMQVFGTAIILVLPRLISLVFPHATASELFYDAFEYAVYAPVSLMLAACIGAWLSGNKARELIPFGRFSAVEGIGCMLLCFWGILVGNYCTNIISSFVPAVQESYEMISGADPVTPLELVLDLLKTAAIPALVEEFVFRGVLLGALRRLGDGFAIVVSALLFGTVHGNFVQMPFAFFVGLVFGYTVVRTRSLVPVIIVHFINNATSGLLTYFQPQLTALFGENYGIYLFAAWAYLGAVGLLMLVFLSPRKFSACIRPYNGCISPARRSVHFFLSPVMLLALTFYFVTAVMLVFSALR